MNDLIDVWCIVLPTSEVLWLNQARGKEYLDLTLRKWQTENPELIRSGATWAIASIRMPELRYNAIQAVCGEGVFNFPEDPNMKE